MGLWGLLIVGYMDYYSLIILLKWGTLKPYPSASAQPVDPSYNPMNF